MDLTHALLTILLVLLAVIGLGLVVVLGLAISAIFEAFALARAVRREIETAGGLLRRTLEGIASGAGLVGTLKARKRAPSKAKE